MESRVLAVGGGIAGLAAALEISKKRAVTVLEARDRLGGRIHTILTPEKIPLELGAEFIHGKSPAIWRLIRAAQLKTSVVPDRHWIVKNGLLSENKGFWDELSEVTDQINPEKGDKAFASFLQSVSARREAKALAKDYVEGFHAAPVQEAGTIGVACSESSSEQIDGQKIFWIEGGYVSLVRYLEERCRECGVHFELNTEVKKISWKKGVVTISALTPGGPVIFTTDAAVITLPLGVLQSGAVQFEPPLDEKEQIIASLGCGVVTKVILQFQSRFWPERNFGFVHSGDEWFPTCWADERGDILTGWAGANKAEALTRESRDFIMRRALETLSKIFDVKLRRIQQLLLRTETHNWKNDPFSRLAYSFIPVNASDSPRALAEPVAETLYFAGEACDSDYQLGTVHGALQSGMRAAKELLGEYAGSTSK